jgi:hypothetical protein
MAGALALALGTLGFGTAAQAEHSIDVQIGVAPPAERVEVVPAPRPGYIYERGHYAWDGNRYVWTEGEFIREREGHHYHPYVLEKHGEGWHYRAGHWDDD